MPNMFVVGAKVVAVVVPKRLVGFDEPKSPPDCGPCVALPEELHSRSTISWAQPLASCWKLTIENLQTQY